MTVWARAMRGTFGLLLAFTLACGSTQRSSEADAGGSEGVGPHDAAEVDAPGAEAADVTESKEVFGSAADAGVGNCVMNPRLCGNGVCVVERGSGFRCECTERAPGTSCNPCPEGYRYHGKYYACLEDCTRLGPRCEAPKFCAEFMGVPMCMCPDFGTGEACARCEAPQVRTSDGVCRVPCSKDGDCFGPHSRCAEVGGTKVCICGEGYAGRICDICAEGYRWVGEECRRGG